MIVSADGVKASEDGKFLDMDNMTAYRLVLNIIATLAFESKDTEVQDTAEEDERPVWPGA